MTYEKVQAFKEACKNNKYEEAQTLLVQLKKEFIKYESFLLTPRFFKKVGKDIETNQDIKNEITLVRETLEYAILLISRNFNTMESEREFKTNMNMLKKYYTTTLPEALGTSERKSIILGINLLRLLATSQMSAFHTELELIPVELREDDYIAYPIQLELFLMEGSYTKLKNYIDKTPSADFNQLINYLVEQSVRKEIASCIEKSYETLRLMDLQKLLIFDSKEATKGFIYQQGWDYQPDNEIVSFKVNEPIHVFTPLTPASATFTPNGQRTRATGNSFSINNANAVIGRNFQYANEVNRII